MLKIDKKEAREEPRIKMQVLMYKLNFLTMWLAYGMTGPLWFEPKLHFPNAQPIQMMMFDHWRDHLLLMLLLNSLYEPELLQSDNRNRYLLVVHSKVQLGNSSTFESGTNFFKTTSTYGSKCLRIFEKWKERVFWKKNFTFKSSYRY